MNRIPAMARADFQVDCEVESEAIAHDAGVVRASATGDTTGSPRLEKVMPVKRDTSAADGSALCGTTWYTGPAAAALVVADADVDEDAELPPAAAGAAGAAPGSRVAASAVATIAAATISAPPMINGPRFRPGPSPGWDGGPPGYCAGYWPVGGCGGETH